MLLAWPICQIKNTKLDRKLNAWLVLFLILFAATGFVTKLNFADELVIGVFVGYGLLAIAKRLVKINRKLFYLFLLIIAGLFVALVQASFTDTPYWVTALGYWQIWRGHIAIAIGLVFLAYKKRVPNWPIIRVLQFNLVFSLIQPFLGEEFMSVIYPVGWVEYRSGILRTVGVFGNPNTNSFFIGLYLLVRWKDYLSGVGGVWAIPSVLVCFLGLITTGSRAVLLLMPVLLVIMWWSNIGKFKMASLTLRGRKIKANHAAVLIVLLGGLFLLATKKNENTDFAAYSFVPDIAFLTNTEDLSEGYFRAIAAIHAFNRFLSSPVFGLGYGAYGTPASFAWPSPYLEEDGLIIVPDASSNRLALTQLDVLLPVVLAESGAVGLFLWMFILWRLLVSIKKYNSEGGYVLSLWIFLLVVATLVGPGLTHPIVVALMPFVMKWLLTERANKRVAAAHIPRMVSDD